MSIRPVDMQIVVHKSQDIHPAKQSVISKQDNELLQAQQQNKEESQKNVKRVINSEKTVFNAIRGDEKNKNKNQKNSQEDSEDSADADKDQKKKPLKPVGGHFDMKI